MSGGIFVTVGTHEQSFARLFAAVRSGLDADGTILGREVFCQFGYSDPVPGLEGADLLDQAAYSERLAWADLVISHGGPGSIMPVLKMGKRLVLAPRQKQFGEHVDDHQISFARHVSGKYHVRVVLDMADLIPTVRATLLAPPLEAVATGSGDQAARRLAELIVSARPATPK